MLGIILCGGQSTRMGSDKGLLKLEANTWAQTAVDKISELEIPVKISVNKNQYADYAVVFPSTDLIVDDASLQLKGPLLGVLSSHIQYPDEDLFILGCDMPLMESSVLKELFEQHRQNEEPDAIIYTNDGEPEPLCGIYTSKGLATILAMLQNNELSRHSMKFMLDHLTVSSTAIKEEQKKYFRNFNAHAELNGL
jgi:molybdopterin-guanine dinucleotide biosynthesis protein A